MAAWAASRPSAGPQSQPAGTSASAELARLRTGTAFPFSCTVPLGRLVSSVGWAAGPADACGELATVGAEAGLMVTTDSIAPASIDSATQVAISGRIAAWPPNSRRVNGPKIRINRRRRRCARSSRWYASTSRSSSRASSGITMFTGGRLPSSRPGSLAKLTGTSSGCGHEYGPSSSSMGQQRSACRLSGRDSQSRGRSSGRLRIYRQRRRTRPRYWRPNMAGRAQRLLSNSARLAQMPVEHTGVCSKFAY